MFGFGTLINYGPLLLDGFPGLAAIYGLRQLRTAYTGFALTVRRSSDNATNNVFFDSSGLVSINSPVSSGGPKLSNWTGSDDLFVVTWFDQSGNGNDATQATTASQPKLANGGVINTINSKATMTFGGTGPNTLNAPNASSISLDSTLSFLTVCSFSDLSANRTLFDKRGPAATYKGYHYFVDSSGNVNLQWNNNSVNTVSATGGLVISTLYSLSAYATESASYAFQKKTTSLGSGALAGSGSSVNTNPLMIGGHVDTLTFYLHGNISEWMLFNIVLTTAQKNIIINNQTTYFSL